MEVWDGAPGANHDGSMASLMIHAPTDVKVKSHLCGEMEKARKTGGLQRVRLAILTPLEDWPMWKNPDDEIAEAFEEVWWTPVLKPQWQSCCTQRIYLRQPAALIMGRAQRR